MNWGAPGSRRSAASPMSASPARAAARKSISPPTGAFTGCGRRRFLAFSRRIAGRSCRGRRGGLRAAAYGGYAQSRFANMDSSRLVLFDAGVAARAAAGARKTRGAAKSSGFAGRCRAARAAADRGRTRRQLQRRVGDLRKARGYFIQKFGYGVGGGGGRQQADGRFRQGRPQDGTGELRAGGVGRNEPARGLLKWLTCGARRSH